MSQTLDRCHFCESAPEVTGEAVRCSSTLCPLHYTAMPADHWNNVGEVRPVDNPDALAYFRCRRCTRTHAVPSAEVGGLDGLYCWCGANAGLRWEQVSHAEYCEILEVN